MSVRREVIGDCTLVYALLDPRSGEARYVGKTSGTLERRVANHIQQSPKRKLPSSNWIRSLVGNGLRPSAIVLEAVPAGGDWIEAERFWIEYLRSLGARLLNLTHGGEGLAGLVHTQEHRAKIAAKLRSGSWFNCEVCSERFWRKRNSISKGDCRFCSRTCYQAWQRGRPKPMACTADGVRAAAAKRRAKTHCPSGHPYSGENLYVHRDGRRVCRACTVAAKRRYRERLSANG